MRGLLSLWTSIPMIPLLALVCMKKRVRTRDTGKDTIASRTAVVTSHPLGSMRTESSEPIIKEMISLSEGLSVVGGTDRAENSDGDVRPSFSTQFRRADSKNDAGGDRRRLHRRE